MSSNQKLRIDEDLQRQINSRIIGNEIKYLSGVKRYFTAVKSENFAKKITKDHEKRVVWRGEIAKIIEFKPKGQIATESILIIPSVINKYYLFTGDIENDGFTGFLSDAGLHCYIIDWGDISQKPNWKIDDLLTELHNAIIFLNKKNGMAISIAGHCMGGMLAIAYTQIFSDMVSRLILISTPWNFDVRNFRKFHLKPKRIAEFDEKIRAKKTMNKRDIQLFFNLANPLSFRRRFLNLYEADNSDLDNFIFLEYWLNDMNNLPNSIASSLFIELGQMNMSFRGLWKAHGEYITPKKINKKTLIICPLVDQVVPIESSKPLIDDLNAEVIYPHSGHIRNVAGSEAKQKSWIPIEKWLKSN